MSDNKIDYILRFNLDNPLKETHSVIQALIQCLTPQETTELLMKSYMTNYRIRYIALKKIVNDAAYDFKKCHITLVDQLVHSFNSLKSKEKNVRAFCLKYLYEFFPENIQDCIIELFLNSSSKMIRKKGFKVIERNYRPSMAPLIIKTWKNYQDSNCTSLILKKLPVSFLIKKRLELLKYIQDPWQVAHLYLRITSKKPELVDELRISDAISYCYIKAKLGKKLTFREASVIYKTNIDNDRIGLLIWSFGQMDLWTVIREISDNMEDIQNAWIKRIRTERSIS